jgi:hypothetical protein
MLFARNEAEPLAQAEPQRQTTRPAREAPLLIFRLTGLVPFRRCPL